MTQLFKVGIKSLKTDGVLITSKRSAAYILKQTRGPMPPKTGRFTKEELDVQRKHVFEIDTKFSIIVPLYNTDSTFLREMIDSVIAQTYANWELCLADGSDSKGSDVEKICREYAEKDERIKYKKLGENKGISVNSNEALAMARGDYISLLDHDDILHPAALHETMCAVCDGGDFIYTDEALFNSPDREYVKEFHFKPDFSPDSLNGNNYITHFTSFKRSLLEKTCGFRSEYDGSQDQDLFLRLTFIAEKIIHIPEILYFWRAHSESVAGENKNKSYAAEAGARAVEDNLRDRGVKATVDYDAIHGSFYRVHYPIEGNPKVSIIIPNYEHKDDLEKCIGSVIEKSTYGNYEIIIVENNSNSREIFDYYRMITAEYDNIKVIKWEGAFNYSAINNYGVREAATGDYVLLLNNDTEVITPGWIEEMLMFVQRRDVGAAGAKLYYPNDTLQHGGVVLKWGGVAGHLLLRAPQRSPGYMGNLIYARNVSAVTAACMLIRRDVWEAVGGLDEEYTVAFNDVDLCLKIRKAGYLIVWTPFAELYHYESKTRGYDVTTPEKKKRHDNEVELIWKKWADVMEKGDPYYNPNLSLDRDGYRPKEHPYYYCRW